MARVLSTGSGTYEVFDNYHSDRFAATNGPRSRGGGLAQALTPLGMYRSQTWIRACVDTLSLGMAMLPCKVYAASEDGDDRKKVAAHGSTLAALIANPYTDGTTMDLFEHLESDSALYAHDAVLLSRPQVGAPPDMLIPLCWDRLGRVAGKWRYWVPGQGAFELRNEDVIVQRYYRGVSPCETLADTLRLEIEAKAYSEASFRHGVRPSGLLRIDTKDDEKRKEMQRALDARHAGSEQNFRAIVVNGETDWKPINNTAVDAELLGLRQLARNECAAGYRIAPPIVGILDDATYSNIDTQYKMHFRITLGPRIKKREETLLNRIINREPYWRNQRLFIRFNMDAVLRASLQDRAEAYVKLIQTGYTLNDCRALEDLPAIPHDLANTPFYPVNLKPVLGGNGGTEEMAAAALTASRLGLANQYGVVDEDKVKELIGALLESVSAEDEALADAA